MSKVFKSNKFGIAMRTLLITTILSLVFSSVTFAEGGGRYKGANAWSFGVHGDTQWTLEGNPEDNPNYVAAAIANRVSEEFIAKGVKFVIQTGDLSDRGTAAGYYSRADAAQKLYDKKIGFFPIRGNHESYESTYYPDSANPPTAFSLDMNLPAYRDAFPQILGMYGPDGKNKANFGAYNFSSPSDILPELTTLDGLSYSFDYGKAGNTARFVFVDTEATGYLRYIPTKHEVYGDPYLYIIYTCYNWFLGSPIIDTDGKTIFKAVYAEDGSPIENMYDINGKKLDSIWDAKRTLVSSRYVGNIIRLLFDKDKNIVSGYYDASGKPLTEVYREDGSSIFEPTYDGESGWLSELIYDAAKNEIPALYDCARNMITAVYAKDADGNVITTPLAFYDKADPATRTQLAIKDLELWVRINSKGVLADKFSGFENTYPVTDWTRLDVESWKTAGTEYYPGKQQAWISAQLDKATRSTTQAFVISHRPVINGNHTDSFFGSSSAVTPDDQNAFFASLQNNDVKLMISAHDHLYNRAIDKSPDGLSEITQIITQGLSTKFYTPQGIDVFGADIKARETQISQEVKNFGYYIYTVDGPRVTANYYSDVVGNFVDGNDYPDGSGSLEVPDFEFVKQDEWGYSLNGKQVVVKQGEPYAGIEDSFKGTNAKILAGTNNSTSVDLTPTVVDDNDTPDDTSDDVVVSTPRALNKAVNTGWVNRPNYKALPVVKTFWDIFKFFQVLMINAQNKVQSDIMSLWGMGELGIKEGECGYDQTDTYVLSMSYDTTSMYYGISNMMMIKNGKAGIATYVNGKWVNAVNENFGGKAKFVLGKYNSKKHGLGTYGIDLKTNTAWAVLNYNADFAVATNVGPACYKKW